jgi:hypothetical protein
LVDILWGDEEEGVPRRGNNGFLVRDVVNLAMEGKFGEIMDLREEVQR